MILAYSPEDFKYLQQSSMVSLTFWNNNHHNGVQLCFTMQYAKQKTTYISGRT